MSRSLSNVKEKVGAAVEELRALLPIDGRSSRAPTALELFANLVFGFAIGQRALVGMWPLRRRELGGCGFRGLGRRLRGRSQ